MTREGFEQRVTAGQKRMYRIARGYLSGEHDCLDAVSEAILKAWQKLDSLHNEQYFDTWITRILIRECINIQRRQSRTSPVPDVAEQPARPSDYGELRQALDALAQKLRVPVILHYMEGFAVRDIAQILRIPKGSVCSRLYEARKQMRQFMEEEIK